VIIALNMVDVAKHSGININVEKLSGLLGVTVIPTIGSKGIGIRDLKNVLRSEIKTSPAGRKWKLPRVVQQEQKS
jgi:ferrous iron transport protein B